MDSTQVAVTVGGIGLIIAIAWFFFGPMVGRTNRHIENRDR